MVIWNVPNKWFISGKQCLISLNIHLTCLTDNWHQLTYSWFNAPPTLLFPPPSLPPPLHPLPPSACCACTRHPRLCHLHEDGHAKGVAHFHTPHCWPLPPFFLTCRLCGDSLLSESGGHEELVWWQSSWITWIFSPYREKRVTEALRPTKTRGVRSKVRPTLFKTEDGGSRECRKWTVWGTVLCITPAYIVAYMFVTICLWSTNVCWLWINNQRWVANEGNSRSGLIVSANRNKPRSCTTFN